MLLYHYNTASLPVLKTKALQGIVSKKEMADAMKSTKIRGGVAPYFNHISFFFDPLPRDIASIIGNGHEVWYKGNVLYEHVVEVKDLEPFQYVLMETPGHFKEAEQFDWDVNDPAIYATYHRHLNDRRRQVGEIGTGKRELEKAIKPYLGKTREAYMNRPAQDNEDFQKYAAHVPHLMIYPEKGYVKVKSQTPVTLE